MTTKEFKEKYPNYSDLEEDELWDKMTEILLNSKNTLMADPSREIILHEPIEDRDGNKIYIEDSSKTVWLNSKGEKVKYVAGIDPYTPNSESYNFTIWNPGDEK